MDLLLRTQLHMTVPATNALKHTRCAANHSAFRLQVPPICTVPTNDGAAFTGI
jgi:hypothetical protein